MVCRRDRALPRSRGLATRCRVEVQRPLVQPRHHVAEIDHQRAAGRPDRVPGAVRHADFQRAIRLGHRQDRQRAVVGMRAGPELARFRRFAKRRVVMARQNAEMARDEPREIILGLMQRHREYTQHVRRQAFVGAVDRDQRLGGPRRAVRIDVGRIGVGRLRQVREVAAVVVDRAEEIGLAQIRRRFLAQRVGEAPRGETVKTALARRTSWMAAVLVDAWLVEEGPATFRTRARISRDRCRGRTPRGSRFVRTRGPPSWRPPACRCHRGTARCRWPGFRRSRGRSRLRQRGVDGVVIGHVAGDQSARKEPPP